MRNTSLLRSASWLASFLLAALSITTLGAAQIQVPGDQPTIQSAILVAAPGDEVVVAPGTYSEAIDFLGKAIVVRSSGGAATTTLDGLSLPSSIVTFTNAEGADSVLEGFTMTQGQGTVPSGFTHRGLAIYIVGASPTIRECVIEDNGLTVVTDG
ncbi:MAG: hypothetical protein KDC38_16920, partial [Planctomycetes bacterium]|nr:hypothetical protein [Planctomycetota bacterium]